MKRLAIGAVAVLVATSAVAEQASHPGLTLNQCLHETLGRSPELEAQRYELSAATDAIWSAQSALFPQLTGDILTQTLNGTAVGPFSILGIADADEGSGNGRRVRANFETVGAFSVRLSYGIYQNGSIMGLNNAPAVAAARSEKSRQEWTYKLTEQEAEYRLTKAFYQAVSDQQQRELNGTKVSLSKERLEILREQVKLDLAKPGDVDLAQAQLTADQQALTSSQHQAWQSMASLAALLGRKADPAMRLDSTEPRIPPIPALPALLETAKRIHPAIGIQQAKITSAQEDWRLAKSNLHPTIKLESGFTEATDFQRTDANLFTVGVSVNVPIFDFGHQQAVTRESHNKLLAQQARLHQVEDDLQVSLIAAVGALHLTESKLADLQRDYVAAKNKATLLETQRELGMIDQLSVVNARQELLTVTAALNAQKLAQRLQYATVQNATGGLWKWAQ